MGLSTSGCGPDDVQLSPRVGHYEFRETTDPPSDYRFPDVLQANMTANACIHEWNRTEYGLDAHDPVQMGSGFDVRDAHKVSTGHFEFTLSMNTDQVPDLECMANASDDIFCWSSIRSEEVYREGDQSNAKPGGNTVDAARVPARGSMSDSPARRPSRDYYWHYLYGWILDPEHREVLFGIMMTSTNHEDYDACPDRTVWTAEWVGEAE
ncbi:hypothetical protein L6R53_32260 [Myxococcota bacterium]|nr:hypothetical protein [Myxococcota bacterium]